MIADVRNGPGLKITFRQQSFALRRHSKYLSSRHRQQQSQAFALQMGQRISGLNAPSLPHMYSVSGTCCCQASVMACVMPFVLVSYDADSGHPWQHQFLLLQFQILAHLTWLLH